MKDCRFPDYPQISIQTSEVGSSKFNFLIGVDGSVIDSKIEHSSGFPRLDESARDALKLCKFQIKTVDGIAIESWTSVEYKWEIK